MVVPQDQRIPTEDTDVPPPPSSSPPPTASSLPPSPPPTTPQRQGGWRRTAGIVVLIILVLGVIALAVGRISANDPTEEAKKAAEPPAKKEEEPKLSEPLRFEGRGDDVVTGNLSAGLHTFRYSYTFEGQFSTNFSIELLDPEGRQVSLIANDVVQEGSSTQGAKAARVPSDGRYTLNIAAQEGPWSLEVE